MAAILAAVGFGLCLWAVYGYLAPVVGTATASLLTGLLTLIAAGILAWTAARLSR
ncbi:MAG: hypothetical protein P8076_04360 [Gammaproteobacteria bacterium]